MVFRYGIGIGIQARVAVPVSAWGDIPSGKRCLRGQVASLVQQFVAPAGWHGTGTECPVRGDVGELQGGGGDGPAGGKCVVDAADMDPGDQALHLDEAGGGSGFPDEDIPGGTRHDQPSVRPVHECVVGQKELLG